MLNPSELLERYANEVRPFVARNSDIPAQQLLALVCAAWIANGLEAGKLAACLMAMTVNLPLHARDLEAMWGVALENKPDVRVMQPMGNA